MKRIVGRALLIISTVSIDACGATAASRSPASLELAAASSSAAVPKADDARGQRVIDACAESYEASKLDCSKFAKAVATKVDVPLPATLDANGLVDYVADPANGWTALPDGNGARAKQAADAGNLVIAGLRGAEHQDHRLNGHVAVVVSRGLDPNGFPTGYWGSITPGIAQPNASLRKTWRREDASRVHYFARALP